MNVIIRINFNSSIELVSFDKSQVVTFNGKFVFGLRNGDCETRSQSDNTVGSPHGQLSVVEVDLFFVRMELFCFVDKVFDSEYVQVQVTVRQVHSLEARYASQEENLFGQFAQKTVREF
ncbi:hypothetical protein Tco_1447144 [Tanacetum coccineum]